MHRLLSFLAGVNACPPGWTYFSSNCYLFQYGETSQQTAEGFCQAEEASLLEIVKSGIICEKPIDPVP